MNDPLAVLGRRPIRDADEPFLRRLYASTRLDELAPTGWSEAQIGAFLDEQFRAQHHHYLSHFPYAAFDLIERGDEPIGRLYVDERDDEFRLIDVALIPAERGHGIGGALMHELLARAGALGKDVRLHVEHTNPALRLYRRLGFRGLEDRGVYLFMQWRPGDRRAS